MGFMGYDLSKGSSMGTPPKESLNVARSWHKQQLGEGLLKLVVH